MGVKMTVQEYKDALSFAHKWIKSRTVTTMMIEVPNEHISDFKDEMKRRGLRVLSSRATS